MKNSKSFLLLVLLVAKSISCILPLPDKVIRAHIRKFIHSVQESHKDDLLQQEIIKESITLFLILKKQITFDSSKSFVLHNTLPVHFLVSMCFLPRSCEAATRTNKVDELCRELQPEFWLTRMSLFLNTSKRFPSDLHEQELETLKMLCADSGYVNYYYNVHGGCVEPMMEKGLEGLENLSDLFRDSFAKLFKVSCFTTMILPYCRFLDIAFTTELLSQLREIVAAGQGYSLIKDLFVLEERIKLENRYHEMLCEELGEGNAYRSTMSVQELEGYIENKMQRIEAFLQ